MANRYPGVAGRERLIRTMQQDTAGSTSRRAFVKCGLLSTGVLVGSAGTGGAADSRTESDDGASNRSIDAGVMRSYQWTPDRRVTVDDAVEWVPAGLEGEYRSYAVSYDHAPSYRAFLFVPTSGGGETEPPVLQAGDSLSLGAVQGTPAEATTRYVTVGLESQ